VVAVAEQRNQWIRINRNEARWLAVVVLGVAVVLFVIYEAGGFAAEPPYTTWCDQGVNGNRIYQSNNGDIAVVAADKTC
jgi:hypothetical protein